MDGADNPARRIARHVVTVALSCLIAVSAALSALSAFAPTYHSTLFDALVAATIVAAIGGFWGRRARIYDFGDTSAYPPRLRAGIERLPLIAMLVTGCLVFAFTALGEVQLGGSAHLREHAEDVLALAAIAAFAAGGATGWFAHAATLIARVQNAAGRPLARPRGLLWLVLGTGAAIAVLPAFTAASDLELHARADALDRIAHLGVDLDAAVNTHLEAATIAHERGATAPPRTYQRVQDVAHTLDDALARFDGAYTLAPRWQREWPGSREAARVRARIVELAADPSAAELRELQKQRLALHRATRVAIAVAGEQHLRATRLDVARAIASPIVTLMIVLGVGAPTLVLGALHVRNQQRTTDELVASETKYRQLTEHTRDVMVSATLTGHITFASNSARLLGHEPEALLGRHILDFVHPDDHAAFLARRAIGSTEIGPLGDRVFRVSTASGDWVWVESSPDMIVDADGTVVGITTYLRDITARRHAEEELGRNLRLLDSIAEISGVGGWSLDYATGAITWTPQMRRIFEVDADYVPGLTTVLAFFDAAGKARFTEVIERSRQDPAPWEVELPFTTAKGRRSWMRVLGRSHIVDDVATTLFGASQDVSVERDVRQGLLDAHAETSRALATLSSYQTALDRHAIVSMLNPDGTVYFVNDRLCERTGYTREELVGRNVTEFLDTTLAPESFALLWATLSAGQPWHGELCSRTKDGDTFWVDATMLPVNDFDGRPERFVGIQYDITERKALQARDALAARTRQAIADMHSAFISPGTRDAFDVALDRSRELTRSEYGFVAEVLHDEDGAPYLRTFAITENAWTDEMRLRFAGTNGHELEFRNPDSLFGAALRSGEVLVTNDVATDPRSGGLPSGHVRMQAFLGVPIQVHGELVAMLGLANRPGGYDAETIASLLPFADAIGQIVRSRRENAARLAAEAALAHAKDRAERGRTNERVLAALLRLGTTESDEPEFANATLDALTGAIDWLADARVLCAFQFERDGQTRRIVARHDGTPHDAGHDDWYHQPLLDGERLRGELRIERLARDTMDDERKAFLARVASALVVGLRQREGSRRLQAAAVAAQAASIAKSQFLATISHEIRTPMNGVLGTLDLLLQTRLEGEQREWAVTAHDSASALLRLLNDVLEFSRFESSRLELLPCPVDARDLVAGVCSLYVSNALEKGVTLECRIAPDVPEWVRTDPTRLRQVLVNLVGNAVKFTDTGRIDVNIAHDGECLHFTVRDTGIGIAEDARERLFTRFAQADSSITRRFGGTGLGLAICKQIVDAMGGTLEVESTLGIGSAFVVEVPAPAVSAPPRDDNPQRRDATDASLQPLRVLVADDNATNQRIMQAFLTSAGHDVTVVGDGAAALDAHRAQPFDIVLMDVQMPVMDGLTATRELRKLPGESGRVPIVAITANAMPGDRERYIELGMTGYLAKPIDRASLAGAIAQAITPAAG